MRKQSQAQPQPYAGIVEHGIYTLDQVKQHLGLGTAALRTARRRGLIVRRIGKKSFICGRDLLAYLEENAEIVP